MRARYIERLHAADRAEQVLRGARVELVRGEYVRAREELEAVLRNDQVQVAALRTHRAIAVDHFRVRRRKHLEPDPAAVAASKMANHGADLTPENVVRPCFFGLV